MTKRVPSPGAVSSVSVPPSSSTVVLHDRHADAAAAGAVGLVAGREARRADQVEQRASRRAGRRARRGPARARARRDRGGVDAAAVVRDLEHDASRRRWPRRASACPPRGLPAASALRRRLDAVADGVAHQVQERVHHPLDQELVDLGVLAAELELDRLPVSRARSRTTNGMRRKISPTGTSRTRITPSRRSRSCRSIVWLFSCTRATRPAARAARRAPARRRGARAADHEIADHPHQLVEPRQVDADDVRRRPAARRRLRRLGAARDGGRCAPRAIGLDARGRRRASVATVTASSVAGDEELERDPLRP